MKHRSKVIDILDNGIAVEFSYRNKKRIEFINWHSATPGLASSVSIGSQGWTKYCITPSGGLWTFRLYNPNKKEQTQ